VQTSDSIGCEWHIICILVYKMVFVSLLKLSSFVDNDDCYIYWDGGIDLS
jgi:hypothetical protein